MTTRRKREANKRRLTDLFVRSKAKPRAAAYLVWDTYQRGLALRVLPTGNKSWVTVYSRHGRPRWLHLGNAGAIGLAEARTLAAEAMLAVARGRDPAAEKRAERGAGTFGELAAKYVEQHAKKHNKSWMQAAALVERFAVPRWGKLQASAITRGDIKQMMAKIEAPIVANQTLAAVSAIFSWGMKEEIVAANPCKLVERNPTKSRERVLSESELPLFWKALASSIRCAVPRSRRSCCSVNVPVRSARCGASILRTAGGKCRASRCRRCRGPAPRTANHTGSGFPRRRSRSSAMLQPDSSSPVCAAARSPASMAPCVTSVARSTSIGRRRTI